MKPTDILNNKELKNMMNNMHLWYSLNKDNMHISRSYFILVPLNKNVQK